MRRIFSLVGVVASLALVGSAVMAQAPEGIPDGVPDEAAVMREIGSPNIPSAPSGQIGPDIRRPAVPGIPAEARAVISDADFVEVFCLTTKWKSGPFFAALDALEQNLMPALAEAEAVAGPFNAPDVAEIRAEANRQVEAVCQSGTVEAAMAATDSLVTYGESVRGNFLELRSEMTSKLQAKGDELRARVESRVRASAESEKAKAQAELNALGARLGSEAQSSIEGEMAGKQFGSAEAAQSYAAGRISASKASVTSQIQARADVLRKEIETRLRAEAEGIVGADREKFESLGARLGGLGDKINAAIASGQAEYEQYRTQAQAKRKALVLMVVDQSIESAKTELEANRGQIEDARADNPEIKSVEGILSEIAADRAALAAAVDKALSNDDEAAFQSAIDLFREKWEGYRASVEQAFVSVSAICGKAGERIAAARVRMDDGFRNIDELRSRCTTSASEECLRVNEFSARFATLTSKMKDVNARLSAVEIACEDQTATDTDSLLALLQEIKVSGEDLETYGLAFEAEKQKVMADSAAEICKQVMPQLKAARVELEKGDLGGLEAALSRCRGIRTEECTAVNSTTVEYGALKSGMAAFLSDASKFDALCGQAIDDGKFLELRDLANYLKTSGDGLRLAAKDLQAKQAEKSSEQAVCAAVLPRLETARSEIASGLADAASTLADCRGKTDNRCTAISAAVGRIGEVTAKAEGTLGKIAKVTSSCRQATSDVASPEFLAELAAIRADEEAIKGLVTELKAEADERWPSRIKSGQPFKVILDVAPSLFDDSTWTGDWRTDQMGTIRGGETYTLTFGAAGWAATGVNEATGRVGTWTYRYGDPDAYQIDLWGRVYKFDPDGLVYDPDFGLVGHLVE